MSAVEELAGGKLLLDHPAEAVARLVISNPERRNALDHDILNALAEVMPRLDRGIDRWAHAASQKSTPGPSRS